MQGPDLHPKAQAGLSVEAVRALVGELALPAAYADIVEAVHRPIGERLGRLRARLGRPVVVGVCGTQASGKTTLCAFLELILRADGLKAQTLALDDLYLSRPAREALAEAVHPLLVTRGPPGTHDVALGRTLLDALTGAAPACSLRMPRFDKAADTLAPARDWPPLEGAVDVVLFEGWCVGARPQAEAALALPVNALERERDPQGVWRRYANMRLATDYADLFGRLDALVMLQAPGFDAVFDWRALQERKLGERLAAQGALTGGRRLMTDADLRLFLAHYQRLTEHILAEMPGRADAVVALAADHAVQGLRFGAALA
jgi:D-glycerate 3-kinase